MPKVTVLMPVYNSEKYLRDAMESILSQTFKDFDYLIIDDASEDNSVEIIKSYEDKRIKLIQNEQNLGVTKTLIKGVKIAKGEYIVRMDSDDISLPQRIEKQFLFMEAHPDVAVCGTLAEIFGSINDVWHYPLSSEEIKCHLLFSSALIHPSVIMRKNILLENGYFYDETIKRTEDYDLWVRISQKFPLANIGEVLFKYRLHNKSVGRVFKEEQDMEADETRKKQLLNLGIDVSLYELELHSKISRWVFEPSVNFLDDMEQWFLKIISANKKKLIYSEDLLIKVMAMKWLHFCGHATSVGLKTWKIFSKSPFSININMSHIQKAKFFMNCLIRR